MRKRINTGKNSAISMKNLSACIEEAEKVLEYSLYLGTALHPGKNNNFCISKENFPDYIETLSKEIWNDCHAFVNGGEFNFFGYKNMAEDLSELYCLQSFWQHALKQDAILFAFSTLRKVIGESYFMSPSERSKLANFTITDDEMIDKRHHGFDFLVKNGNPQTGLPWIELKADTDGVIHSVVNARQKGNNSLKIEFNHYSANYIR